MKTTILFLVLSLGIYQLRAAESPKDNGKSAPMIHNILSNKLPVRLLTVIKTTYKDYWITDLYKETNNGKISYYITLENADRKVKLNTTHTATWAVAGIVSKDIAAR